MPELDQTSPVPSEEALDAAEPSPETDAATNTTLTWGTSTFNLGSCEAGVAEELELVLSVMQDELDAATKAAQQASAQLAQLTALEESKEQLELSLQAALERESALLSSEAEAKAMAASLLDRLERELEKRGKQQGVPVELRMEQPEAFRRATLASLELGVDGIAGWAFHEDGICGLWVAEAYPIKEDTARSRAQ